MSACTTGTRLTADLAAAAQPMPAPAAQAQPAGARAPDRGLAPLALLASIVVVFLAGSSAPTPLYATYQHAWHFSLITTTVVFGVYALAVLAGLLFLGRLSDHVGRRPVVLTAIAAQIAAMIVFASAADVGTLLLARVVQGVATGGAVSAIGAAMLDIHPARGTLTNAAAPGAGTATGAIASGLVVQYLPAPTHLIYLAIATVLGFQFLGVSAMRDPAPRSPGARSALMPQVRLPRAARGPAVAAAPVLFAVWALAGFYGSLGPALLRTLSGSASFVLGGAGLFLLAGTASVTTVVLRSAAPRRVMLIGIAGLILGVAGILAALAARSAAGFLAATIVAGAGFGSGFQGGLRTVIQHAGAAERAGVLSVLYLVSYLGMGGPAVAAGYLIVHGHGIMTVAGWYSAFLVALAATALLALGGTRQRPA